MESTRDIPGYTHGTSASARSPLSLDDLARMRQSVLFGEEDERWLRASRDVLADQVEDVLDVWYDFVGSTPHLVASFGDRTSGEPLPDYLLAVRKRFGQWILDTASARYDRDWLDYQEEIALRHHSTKKNATDGAHSTDVVPFRDLFLLAFPVTFTLKPFLAKKGHAPEEVDAMYAAWLKATLLQVTLWSRPYVHDGEF